MPDSKESVVRLEDQGNIHIAEDVVASVAALAISDLDGVASLVSNSGVADLIGKKNLSRGVKILLDDTKVNVDAFILIKYGFSIPKVAQKAQSAIKDAIENMTGLEPGVINIHVNGISFDKDSKK